VARNSDCQLVGGAGARHRTDGVRVTDTGREIRVGLGDTGRDGSQCGPHFLLKRRAADVERQIDGARRVLDQLDNAADEAIIVCRPQRAPGKTVPQLLDERRGVVAK